MDWAIIDSGCWVQFMNVSRWKRRRARQSGLKECMDGDGRSDFEVWPLGHMSEYWASESESEELRGRRGRLVSGLVG